VSTRTVVLIVVGTFVAALVGVAVVAVILAG
jgi:hypothetical protein